ncbi:hypothetical protein [Kitasatospora kifunensis]|uniref:Uncharacterized protein n=1 Tax=Kitasatospora kifunensis TaxID=58351 RepID=A0A7W7VV80_KITKI|nr:hypothetical protein [Kitasatospora kifunensis]MBB4923205.1 hypothetical protein [Kitasatospora kifunensis]
MTPGRVRVRLRLLLDELGDVAPQIDPFAPDDSGGLLYRYIAALAAAAAALARELEPAAQAAVVTGEGD